MAASKDMERRYEGTFNAGYSFQAKTGNAAK
jgi:hypothetical protein